MEIRKHNIFIITDHKNETIEKDGYKIQVIPVWEWLTRDDFYNSSLVSYHGFHRLRRFILVTI